MHVSSLFVILNALSSKFHVYELQFLRHLVDTFTKDYVRFCAKHPCHHATLSTDTSTRILRQTTWANTRVKLHSQVHIELGL